MPKTFKQLPSFEGVNSGQTATLRLPIGQTYHTLYIAYSGVTLAQMTGIRVIANGKAIHTYASGEVLNQMNMHDGREDATNDSILIIDFERFGMEGRSARELTALGTGAGNDPTPVQTLSVEIDIDSAASGPALSCKAQRSAPTPLGIIKKVRRFNYNAPGAGDYEISDLPRGDLVNQVFFRTGDVNSVKLERDSYVEFERTDTENALIQRNAVRDPQANQYVYDPVEFGNGSETLATKSVNDLRFILAMAQAATVETMVVYLGALEA